MTKPVSVSAVMVVEDRPDDLRFITEILRDAFGPVEVRAARTLEIASAMLAQYTPDLVVLDLNLPDGTGATLLPFLKAQLPSAIVVVVTVFDDDEHLFTALQGGADGYLLKDESRAAAAEILRDVLAGHPPLSARMARRVLKFIQAAAPKKTTQSPDLTPRETEILGLLARGHTVASAAAQLGISAHTVKSHVKNLYRKLDVSSRANLVRTALDERLV
jgi:DNA-binding NarL/FixJ family response regulator